MLKSSRKESVKLTELYQEILEGMSIVDFINRAAVLVDCSLVITDTSFRVLAFSTSCPVTDLLWKENIQRGFCTYRFIQEVQELLPKNGQMISTEPFLANCDYSKENKLVSSIVYQNQKVIGYLILLDNGKGILPEYFEYLKHFSVMSTFILRQQPQFHRLFGNMAENILDELLETGNSELASKRFRAAGYIFPTHIRCLIFVPLDTSDVGIKYIHRTLRMMFLNCILSEYHGNIVCVVDEKLVNIERLVLSNQLKKTVKYIGIGPSITDVDELIRCVELAETTCVIHNRLHYADEKKYPIDQFVRCYDDYQFYNLLLSCSDDEILLDNIHPALLMLQQYDRENNTLLMLTLRCFLENNRNIAETSNAMYIHRNTVHYRLGRIRELTGIDLENYEERFRLECSFKILDCLSLKK